MVRVCEREGPCSHFCERFISSSRFNGRDFGPHSRMWPLRTPVLKITSSPIVLILALFAGHAAGDAFTPLQALHANPGDMVTCKMGPVAHWLLASNRPGYFINVQPGSPSFEVKEVHFSEAGGKSDIRKCRNLGPGLFGAWAVARARLPHLDRSVYYHLLRCNCEHYVKAWAGMPLCSNQAAMCPCHKCRQYLTALPMARTSESLTSRRGLFGTVSKLFGHFKARRM
ncbi:uncharacterized protein LOC117640032 [Thrips palmi]|uniref:Uncharacterized protein LOC117640032 n=1 Tax=Thrips palmi TaxID=161013 RepID=A0A6P8XYC6_THRPL|nr:uncharacterized protein LOC117640032 [Thrips palmi]